MKCFVGKEGLVAESGQAARFRRELPANALRVCEVFFLDCEPDMPAVHFEWLAELFHARQCLACRRAVFNIRRLLGRIWDDVRVVLLADLRAPASQFFCVV